MPGEFDDDEAFDRLAERVAELDRERGTGGNYAFYLSVPPQVLPAGRQPAEAVRAVHAAAAAPGGHGPGAGSLSRSRSVMT